MDLIVNGGHTELALPAGEVAGRLAVFKKHHTKARFIAFGWGEREVYMARHPSLWAYLRAGFPAPSVLLVSWFTGPPKRVLAPRIQIFRIRVTPAGAKRLARYIWHTVATQPNGAPRLLGAVAGRMGLFYASKATYDLFHTCNTWSAQALHVAGVPVSAAGVVFASQLVRRVRQAENISDR